MKTLTTDTWIVVADASQARVFKDECGKLRLVREHDNSSGRARDQELVSDRPGRIEKGKGQGMRSSLEPRTSAHDTEATRFAGVLTSAIDHAYGQHLFKWLVIVAPPHFLGLLREGLPRRVLDATIATVARDYVKLSGHELDGAVASALGELADERRLARHEHP